MLWVTRGRNPTQTILNDNGLKWTREMGDLRCRAACRQDPPSQQIPRTQFLPPSTWPLRLTCLAVLQFPRLLGRQPCSLLKKDSVPANVLRVILIGPTQVMHPPQSQSLQPREGCVWTSWPESPAPSFLQSQDTESASQEPHRANTLCIPVTESMQQVIMGSHHRCFLIVKQWLPFKYYENMDFQEISIRIAQLNLVNLYQRLIFIKT